MDDKDITKGQAQRKVHETREEGKIIQLIVFNLGDEEFGSDIAQVREIIRRGAVTPIPDSPDFIKGVTNVRGEIAVVIDLKKRFFLRMKKEVEERHIIMTEQDKNLFGLMVDEVTEVLRISQDEIKPTPELVTRIDRIYISGVLTLEDRLIMILDLEKVLSGEELARLSEIQLRHRVAIEKAEEKRERVEEEKPEEHIEKVADSVKRIADSKKKKTKRYTLKQGEEYAKKNFNCR